MFVKLLKNLYLKAYDESRMIKWKRALHPWHSDLNGTNSTLNLPLNADLVLLRAQASSTLCDSVL